MKAPNCRVCGQPRIDKPWAHLLLCWTHYRAHRKALRDNASPEIRAGATERKRRWDKGKYDVKRKSMTKIPMCSMPGCDQPNAAKNFEFNKFCIDHRKAWIAAKKADEKPILRAEVKARNPTTRREYARPGTEDLAEVAGRGVQVSDQLAWMAKVKDNWFSHPDVLPEADLVG